MNRELSRVPGSIARARGPVNDFAHAFRTALSERHATLRGLSVALAERGHETSTPLLAAWRAGTFVPGGPEDLARARALETLLELRSGELSAWVDPDVPGTRRSSRRPGSFSGALPIPAKGSVPVAGDPGAARVSASVQRARTALGFDRTGLMSETRVEVLLELDVDGTARWITQTTEWVSHSGGVDSFPVVLVTPTPVKGRGRVEPVEGCRLGPSYVDLAEGLFATSLVLPAPLREGEVARTVHRTYLPADAAPEQAFEHRVHQEVAQVSVEVAFADGLVPSTCTGFVRLDEVEQESAAEVSDGVGRVLRTDFGPGGVGLRWSW